MYDTNIVLENERLKVTVLNPGKEYTGSRFDWHGFISQVVLDQKHTFCVSESKIPGQGSGGIGLCNEFGITTPIGYDEVKPGQKFPKLGTGLLTRDEKDYFFFDKYEVTPFEVDIETHSSACTFKVLPVDCNGYKVEFIKKITLDENTLKISYSLKNLGTKKISTEEYCHNFIGINDHPAGDGYILKFPYEIVLEETPDVMRTTENEIHFISTPLKDFHCKPQNFNSVKNHYWELIYKPDGVGIRETSDFTPHLVAVWGTTHVISPEVFIKIDLNPGESLNWTRTYQFFSC